MFTVDDLKITGLDLSLSSPGIAHTRKGKYLHSVSVKTDSAASWYNRVRRIVEEILYEVKRFEPDFIFIENYSFNSKFGRELAGEVHGVVRYHLQDAGFSNVFRVIAPTQLKTFVTGNTKAKKRDMVEGINNLFGTGFRLSQNDQADALGIAMIGHELVLREYYGLDAFPALPKNQQTVLQKALDALRSDPEWLRMFNF